MDGAKADQAFDERASKRIRAQRGKPLKQADIEYDWNERGNFTRRYAHSVNAFAVQAFHLDEGVDEANEAMQEMFGHYLANPTDLYEAHSFHWSGALYARLWSFFAADGRVAEDRMSSDTQSLFKEVMFAWSKKASPTLDPSTEHIWRFPNSENHHAMGIVTTWFFCKVLKEDDAYSDRAFEEGRTAGEHYHDWSAYLKAYFRSRAGKGQSVEIASKNYNAHTIQNWYMVHDFAEDESLARAAGYYLDLYWATWAEEQIDGVRGGGKTRIYQGAASRTAAGGQIERMAAHYLDGVDDDEMGAQDWVVLTSGYRMPEVVRNLAQDVDGRGEYEVKQRCMGLVEPGWTPTTHPPVIPFRINGLRSDFGGFLRYSYCTPDFVMGALMMEPRPNKEWSGVAAQNRWQGVIFRGHRDAAIVPECQAVDTHLNLNNHANTMNQHWSVQKGGTLITQKLKGPEFSYQTGDSRVWISSQGLSEPVERDGWVFVEAAGAFAAVRVVGAWAWDGVEETGRWLKCDHDLSPIVIEAARKTDYGSAEAFQSAVAALPAESGKDALEYKGLSGDTFRFFVDYSALPKVNGETIDLAPSMVYDSPFVRSAWDSGVVSISYGGESRELDFNL